MVSEIYYIQRIQGELLLNSTNAILLLLTFATKFNEFSESTSVKITIENFVFHNKTLSVIHNKVHHPTLISTRHNGKMRLGN